MRVRKADKNQPEIVAALREIGAEVTLIHTLGRGVPDILISYRGRWYVAEIKNLTGRGNRLTPYEADWAARQQAPTLRLLSPAQAVEALLNS